MPLTAALTAAPFTVVPQKLIIYTCGASQTPSLHVVVSLGLLYRSSGNATCAISSDL